MFFLVLAINCKRLKNSKNGIVVNQNLNVANKVTAYNKTRK